MSIHADDEFSLRIALESELDDVVPRDGLAAVVIARHRRSCRRRVAGAVGLVVAFAGIGVPVGVASASGGAPSGSGPVVLHLASYALKMPGGWHLASAQAGRCAEAAEAPGSPPAGPGTAAAAASPAGCVLMMLTTPFSQASAADPHIPPGATEVPIGRYDAWDSGSGDETRLVIEGPAPGGQTQDLVISSSGLSQAALVSLVSAGLSKAA